MITSYLFLAAESIIVDETSKSVSILNIIEEMVPEGLPIFIQRFAIGCFTVRESLESEQRYDLRFQILNNDAELFSHIVRIDFQNKLKNRAILSLNGLQIPEAGKLTFKVFLADGLLGTYEVQVVLRSNVEVKS